MKLNFKILISLGLMMALGIGSSAKAAGKTQFADESLNYDIVYHWGLIWKHAASATLSLNGNGNFYNTALTARTVSWADKMYRVRDTLTCRIQKDGLKPQEYIKASHEGKHYGKDVVRYSYADGNAMANCTVERKDKETKQVTLQAVGQAYDMLSVFYYLRSLDYDSLKAGSKIKTTVFSGRKKENLTVTYVKQEDVKLRDKTTHPSHHITFTFTQDGQKKSSDDIHCWLSTDDLHIPLMIKGSVSVGEVRVYYNKGN
ncbi:MAG: DUF3108 domain-containing protein [Muribaculaceae bacterium]